jgi:hypothetical protein
LTLPSLAKVALGVAVASEVAPSTAAALAASPSAVSAVYIAAPYSGAVVDFTHGLFIETGPPKGWGYLSSGIRIAYDIIREIVSKPGSTACEK